MPKCRSGDIVGKKDCSLCGQDYGKPSKDNCDSNDCKMWNGKCRSTTVAKDLDGKDVKMDQWINYWGPTRPYMDTGDWLKFGNLGQVIGPGSKKPAAQMTEADAQAEKDGEKLVYMHFPGNMKNIEVKTMRGRVPGPEDKEPHSAEAKAAMAEYLYKQKRDLATGLPTRKPCDELGRIQSSGSRDGTFCEDDAACVTALPADFAKKTGKSCWKWFMPECKQPKCDPPKWCPPKTHQDGSPYLMPDKDGVMRPPPPCTPPKPCPGAKPCEKPYWQDTCKANAGQPWCVSADALRAYDGPIEIKCSASGKDLTETQGSPDGCWWLKKYTKDDLQRLPGRVNRWYADEDVSKGGVFVKTGGYLSEKQAESWIATGKIPEDEHKNGDFLKTAKIDPWDR